jgi:NTP pyrophosphatase (non-canonical NTP hydrolase)
VRSLYNWEAERKIQVELDRAYAKHGREPWGRREFYAILKEEVDELWDAIKNDEPADRVHEEAVQVAAVVRRYLETGDRYGWS